MSQDLKHALTKTFGSCKMRNADLSPHFGVPDLDRLNYNIPLKLQREHLSWNVSTTAVQ